MQFTVSHERFFHRLPAIRSPAFRVSNVGRESETGRELGVVNLGKYAAIRGENATL
jgi:hypothetical protein